ncbi:MAG: rhodanese-like domain-containing protein [Clostridia bacterium]|nr:rhodanese-like domain-containing protein [Clostridia bacterium]
MLATTLAVSCSSETTKTTDTITSTQTSDTIPVTASAETSAVDSTSSPVTTAPVTQERPTVHKIDPEEAKTMIDQGNVIIVDVRRSDEFVEGHIPGAILVPNETILTEAATMLPDKNAVILIYCRSGRRSAEAAEKLLSLGYVHVYDFGGILDWPYDITK